MTPILRFKRPATRLALVLAVPVGIGYFAYATFHSHPAVAATSAPTTAATVSLVPASSTHDGLTAAPAANRAAAAATMPADTGSAPADSIELARLQAHNAVLLARKQGAQLEADIRRAQRDADSATGTSALPALPPGMPLAPAPFASSRSGVAGWTLVGTAAYDGRPSATLSIDGASRDVHVGDTIDGWTVRSIADAAVTLMRGKQSRTVRL
jgi:type IV pilus biogenesis protein PilP